jgi:hypothetical protein
MAGRGAFAARYARPLLVASAVAWTMVWWVYATAFGDQGDMLPWWTVPLDDPYGGLHGEPGFYGYSPAILQLLAPLRLLPLEAVIWLFAAAQLAALAYCARRWTPLVLLAPPVLAELMAGNVHVLYAGAIVAAFRWPGLWAFMLLTKVTPGVGLLWFALRREWRSLAIAVGVTVAIAFVSFVVAPGLWLEWVAMLARSAGGSVDYSYAVPTSVIAVPLLVRLPLALLLIAWGALTGRRWTVPVAAMLALPVLWTTALAMLIAVIPLARRQAAVIPASGSLEPQPKPVG